MISKVFKIIKLLTFRCFGAFANILIAYFIAKNLAIDEAGITLFSIALIQLLAQAINLGSGNVIIRMQSVSQKRGADNTYLFLTLATRTSLMCFVLIAFSLLLLTLFNTKILPFDRNDIYFVVLVCSSSFILSQVDLLSKVLIANNKNEIGVISQSIFQPSIFIFVSLYQLYNSQVISTESVLELYFISSFLAFMLSILLVILSSNILSRKKYGSKENIYEYNVSLRSIATVTVLSLLLQNFQQFTCAYFLEEKDLALFNVSKRISFTISFILVAVNLYSAPIIARYFAEGNIRAINELSKFTGKLLLFIALPISISIILFGKNILFIFGKEYINGYLVLIILCSGQIFNVISGSVAYILNMTKNEKDNRFSLLILTPINLVISIMLTKFYGLWGAALSATLLLVLHNLILVYFVKNRLGFNTLNVFRKI